MWKMWQKICCVYFIKNFIKYSKNALIRILINIVALCLAFEIVSANPTDSAHSNPQRSQVQNPQSTQNPQRANALDSTLDFIPKKYLSMFSTTAHFFPAASLSYALIIKDTLGFKQQAIGWLAVVSATYVVKYSLYFIAPYAPNALSFAKRPTKDSYEAFPSGHTASAFAAVGFVAKRYGYKLGIPALIVAVAFGESRILLEKHTILQVICGGILGFLLSFFCASPFKRRREPNILPNLPQYKERNQNNHTVYNAGLLALLLL